MKMKCQHNRTLSKGDGEGKERRRESEEKIARKGSCKREEASGATRPLGEAWVLG